MYEDILYETANGIATITINRPQKHNAFRGKTCEELISAFHRAGWDRDIGAIVLTGAGEKAFCTGGDQAAHEGSYDGRGMIGLPIEDLQRVIRDVPKPVIAKVRGYAIGGGNVLALICDLTIAAESAIFGQVGPKMGSVDPGFGTAYMARVIGEKRAREVWYLCRQYDAATMLQWGLVNAVVPGAELRAETRRWADEIALAEGWLETQPHPAEVDPQKIPAKHRQLFLTVLKGMVSADGVVDDEERERMELLEQMLLGR